MKSRKIYTIPYTDLEKTVFNKETQKSELKEVTEIRIS